MLLIVLPVVWFAVVLVTLAMLRTVALSDEEHDLAVAGWLAQGDALAGDLQPGAEAIESPGEGGQRERFRATG
jgi:hypothetical protein